MLERLQKLIAQAGIASRRHAEELITTGDVMVNGAVVTELGTKADPAVDQIKVRGSLINRKLAEREPIYVLLFKPKGYLCSVSDPENRKLVTTLIPKGFGRLHPVGRLDYNSEGLILLTNDGAFTKLVTAASNHIAKVYHVKVKGMPAVNALERLRRGIVLEDGVRAAPCDIELHSNTAQNSWFVVTLYEGRNQQIRKMFASIGHSVLKLQRVAIGPISDGRLGPGDFRLLAPHEVRRLKRKESGTKAKQRPTSAPRAIALKQRATGGPARPVKSTASASRRAGKAPTGGAARARKPAGSGSLRASKALQGAGAARARKPAGSGSLRASQSLQGAGAARARRPAATGATRTAKSPAARSARTRKSSGRSAPARQRGR